ncbi:secreted protein [Sphingobium indicum BiD32]|uniref:High-potential iron-sulfur protein n=1 Tax=Sphingobium indicum BiD32 TaxID=1301087 RepID=N1MQF3_9SPHN|nr:high-potential iron-sulfur protein [Sphingobium indicum]CCW17897.1 secreted protein [Sphingobium indicum BiD32]
MPDSEGVLTRRAILGLVAIAPLVLAAQAPASSCADPATLSAAQKSMRKSLGFKSPAPDPAKACGTCAFFTGKGADCGACALLSGGVVPANGVCDSWAKKG